MKIHFEKINEVFRSAENEGRNFLLEHEVYQILGQVGIKTPKCLFVKKGQRIKQEDLAKFRKSALVIKVVNPFIVHKTDVGGIQFVERSAAKINRSCKIMLETIPKSFQEWVKKFPGAKKGKDGLSNK